MAKSKHLGPFRIAVREEDGWINGWYQSNDPADDRVLLFKVRQAALDMAGTAGFDGLMNLARIMSEGMLMHVMPDLKREDVSVHYMEPGTNPGN